MKNLKPRVHESQNKLAAQTFDGTSVIAGELNGLQTKVHELAPQEV